MLIRRAKRWEIKENEATPEDAYLNRRQIMAGGASLGGLAAVGQIAAPAAAQDDQARMALEAVRNETYVLDRDITPEEININYNNFYEYGSHKSIAEAAALQLKPRPWAVVIDGLVDNPVTIDIDDLMNRMGLEERLYRHRCVEAWSMTVPWVGFSMAKLVDFAQPQNDARFVRFETFGDTALASGIRTQPWYPWPYIEGLTIEEARNELPFLAVGAYGKVVANSMGAPIRLHLPWKYGFKSIKSIVKISFTAERPVGFWEALQANEYGFWANVNPAVAHPRWSQAT
ncbi:MAG TPA: protein-methionine-sulfoxide reductase catalytic subunit MsrP, partial [Devosiaceae bacterium]|nr:protein-methionine-sulfoxide reductase catalytic subunit MsrP [Devosiaceae bacterium]